MSSGALTSPDGLAWRLPAGRQGGQVLMSRQAARCLRYIAQHPDSSSVAVQDGVGINYPAQVSQVLLRLERGGLIQTPRGRRALNAWQLTDRGAETLRALPEGIYE